MDRVLRGTVPGYDGLKRRYWRPFAARRGGKPRPLRPEVAEMLPHLVDYNAMFEVFWLPYVMNSTYPNVRSNSVNTDGYGFRYSIGHNGGRLSLEIPCEDTVSLVAGASVAFGVGCTSDAATVPSILAKERGEPWLNITMRGYTFAQNLVQTLFFLPKIGDVRQIVLFGGVNDINQYFLTHVFPKTYGCFFEWMDFFDTLNIRFKDPAKDRYQVPDDFQRHFQTIKDPTKDRAVFEESLRNTLTNWKMIADAKGAHLCFALEPVVHWSDRELSPEEERLMSLKGAKKTDFERRIGRAYREWYGPFLKSTCDDLRIDFIDMNQRFGEEDATPQWLFIDNVHLTDLGTAEAARLIGSLLEPARSSQAAAASLERT